MGAGFLVVFRRFRRSFGTWVKRLTNRDFRGRRKAEFERFLRFKAQYEPILRDSLNGRSRGQKKALIISRRSPCLEVELSLIKALQIAGYEPVVLIESQDKFLRNYYEVAGVKEIIDWGEFADAVHVSNVPEAVLQQSRSIEELLRVEYAGARVGKAAVATVLRQLWAGSLDLQSEAVNRILAAQLQLSMASAVAVQKILRKVRPALMLSADIEYTPQAEIFDVCLGNGIDAIKFEVAHKTNFLILKRYTLANRDQHFSSLSRESWKMVREMEWTEARREELQRELHKSYASGDWYGISATQFNKRFMDAIEVRKLLGLDPAKKTAFIFAHISWDASFMWGKDLFRNYEEWLIETVRAACANDHVNWVIKIHPANVLKSLKGRFKGEPAEVLALRKHIGELPSHVFFLPAESEISTFSLFQLMDYCLTVRGTVGIEAATLGIPVLTAGTGRYDHQGFTLDSDTPDQYRNRLSLIQEIPRLSPEQCELAERFAYGLFLLRPFPLTSVSFEFTNERVPSNDFTKTRVHSNVESRINITQKEDWHNASDLSAFAQWINDSRNADFLMPVPEEVAQPL